MSARTPRRHVFDGFKRSACPRQWFQSDEERRFAVIIDPDHEPNVIRWVNPGRKQFRSNIYAERYEPDFVVETKTEKLIVEIKASN